MEGEFVKPGLDGRRPQGYPVRLEQALLPTVCASEVAALFGRLLPALTTHSAYRNGERVVTTYRRTYR